MRMTIASPCSPVRLWGAVLLILPLLALAGCSTPKSAPSQFAAFSKATSSLAQISQKTYVIAVTVNSKQTIYSLSKNPAGFDPSTYAINTDNVASFGKRMLLLQALQLYAQSLSDIFSSDDLSALKTNVKNLCTTLDSLKANETLKPYFSDLSLSFSDFGNYLGIGLSRLFESRRNAVVMKALEETTPTINGIVAALQFEFGMCATASGKGSSGIGSLISSYYDRYLIDASKSPIAGGQAGGGSADSAKSAKSNTIESLIQMIQTRDTLCNILILTQEALAEYGRLHAMLSQAFKPDHEALSDALVDLQLKLQNIDAVFSAVSQKEKN